MHTCFLQANQCHVRERGNRILPVIRWCYIRTQRLCRRDEILYEVGVVAMYLVQPSGHPFRCCCSCYSCCCFWFCCLHDHYPCSHAHPSAFFAWYLMPVHCNCTAGSVCERHMYILLAFRAAFFCCRSWVHTPCGPRKSGMPHEVEMPSMHIKRFF